MCDRVRNHRGQTIPNYPGLCHSFSHYGPQPFPSLNKIVVFDDLCVVKETGHYQELPKRLKIIWGRLPLPQFIFYFLWCPFFYNSCATVVYFTCYLVSTVFHNYLPM